MRLLGNTLLIQPLPDANEQLSSGGILCVNTHKKTNLKFLVLAKGPGEFVKRRKGVRVWTVPEVEVGECIISRCELDNGLVRHAFDDGSGRLIIDARAALLSWRQ